MRLRVLGCSGGIGGRHMRTTSFLVDGDVLLDAGTGVGDLSLAELSLVDHIFVTHSHLDHVTSIAFIADTVGGMRAQHTQAQASRATIATRTNATCNWELGPHFTHDPSAKKPLRRYAGIELGRTVTLAGRAFTPLPAIHTVPAVGFLLDSGSGSLVFTGDTGPNDALWEIVNRLENLKYLIIETAFANKERHLAELSKHLCPSMLAEELVKFEQDAEVYVTHLKPGETELTMQEIEESSGRLQPRMLQNNQVFEF